MDQTFDENVLMEIENGITTVVLELLPFMYKFP